MSEARAACPVCGSEVRVLSSDEGTHAYAPLVSATVLRRVRESVWELAELRKEMADAGGMGSGIHAGAEQRARSTLRMLDAALATHDEPGAAAGLPRGR